MRIFTRTVFFTLLGSFLLFSGCATDEGKEFYDEADALVAHSSGSIANGVIYELPEMGNSGISGTVTITDLGVDGSHIFIDLNNTDPEVTYPAHIHLGPADGGGPVIVNLNPVDGQRGTSTTIVTHRDDNGEPYSYDQITGNEEYYIAAHSRTHQGPVVVKGSIGNADPTPFPCEDCAGSVVQLTFAYNGVEPGRVQVVQTDNGDTVFDRVVNPNEEFTAFGNIDDTLDDFVLGSSINILVDGVLNATIDTSCATSIGPGLVAGDFGVVMGFSSLVHGPLCPFEEELPCTECDGKVTELTMQYEGEANAFVRVEQKKGETVFEGLLNPFQVFTFQGVDKKGTLGSEIRIFVEDVLHTEIHTSCSDPIGPGLKSGDFEVLNGYSRNGEGPLCPVGSDIDDKCKKYLKKCEEGNSKYCEKYEECINGDNDDDDGDDDDEKDDKCEKYLKKCEEGNSKYCEKYEECINGDNDDDDGDDDDDEKDDKCEKYLKKCEEGNSKYCEKYEECINGDNDDDDGDDDDDEKEDKCEKYLKKCEEGNFKYCDKYEKCINGGDHDDDDGDDDDGDDDDGDDDDGDDDDGDDDDGDDDDNNQQGCNTCDGKVTQLTLRFEELENRQVRIVQKKGDEVFSGVLGPNQLVTINGTDKKGTLGTEITIFLDGEEHISIHTSCSDPIGLGLEFGSFEIIDGFSRNGGQLCKLQESNGGITIP